MRQDRILLFVSQKMLFRFGDNLLAEKDAKIRAKLLDQNSHSNPIMKLTELIKKTSEKMLEQFCAAVCSGSSKSR
jgi:hypothetical protein